jgi:hypothetical protein
MSNGLSINLFREEVGNIPVLHLLASTVLSG